MKEHMMSINEGTEISVITQTDDKSKDYTVRMPLFHVISECFDLIPMIDCFSSDEGGNSRCK